MSIFSESLERDLLNDVLQSKIFVGGHFSALTMGIIHGIAKSGNIFISQI